MASQAIQEGTPTGGQDSPLEIAKRLVTPMCRQPKEAHWLGVRMENFLRAYGKRIEAVGVEDVCDYLEGLMRKGQVEWQVRQSLVSWNGVRDCCPAPVVVTATPRATRNHRSSYAAYCG